ncbi:hypothetical protein STEG23_003695, partial [Scotinomys teguina]
YGIYNIPDRMVPCATSHTSWHLVRITWTLLLTTQLLVHEGCMTPAFVLVDSEWIPSLTSQLTSSRKHYKLMANQQTFSTS